MNSSDRELELVTESDNHVEVGRLIAMDTARVSVARISLDDLLDLDFAADDIGKRLPFHALREWRCLGCGRSTPPRVSARSVGDLLVLFDNELATFVICVAEVPRRVHAGLRSLGHCTIAPGTHVSINYE